MSTKQSHVTDKGKAADKGKELEKGKETPPPAGTPAGTAPAAPTTPTPDQKPKRSRSAVSTEKMLAIHISNLTSILKRDAVVAILSDEDKAKIEAAAKSAADLNAKTIEPIKTAIAEIEKQLQELFAKSQQPGADFIKLSADATTLSKQLAKKKTLLEQYTKVAA